MTIVHAHRRSESDPWIFSAEAEALVRQGYRLFVPACIAFEAEHDEASMEHAWRLAQEGVSTAEIARVLGVSVPRVDRLLHRHSKQLEDEAWHASLRMRMRVVYEYPYYAAARREHAWRLRQEGETFKEIGRHLDVTKERARQIVSKFERLRR